MTVATAYAQRGYKVFPCHPDKTPATPNGFKDATRDADQIRTWWTDNPDYLIAVATGSGLLVVDLDSYKPGGHPQWDTFAAGHGGLPPTHHTTTGQGGHHHWFTVDEEVKSNNGKIWPNVDIKCEGGYVIVPPSRSIYGAYTVVQDSADAPAPEWLLEAVRAKQKEVATYQATDTDIELNDEDRARGSVYAERVIDLELKRLRECTEKAVGRYGKEPYAGPDWNATTYEVACNLLELAYAPWNPFTEADAHRALLTTAPRDPGFDDVKIGACWDSARKKIDGQGRRLPAPQGGGMFIPFPTSSAPVDPSQFFIKGEGLDVLRLAAAVLELGPLAVENTDGRSFWRYSAGVWVPSKHEIQDRCAVVLGSRFRVNHVTTVIPVIAQQCVALDNIITCDPVPDYINVRNGMLHWSTGHLYGHDPSFRSTVQLPVEWDPAAICPAFDQFAKEVMADDALDYLWELLGYLVYSGNPLQRAILFHGSGINGKGTLLRVIKALLGEVNVSAVTLTDISDTRFEVASLHGKIANLAGDIDAAYMKNTAKFKAITGEDTIRAERKFEHGFMFQCWAVPVFSANEFWKSSDTTTGYKRRWQVLPFPHTFDAAGGQGLTERLTRETPGILVKAVAALRSLMDRGDFETPVSAEAEKERFELAADQVNEWLTEDPCVTHASPKDRHHSTSSAEAYRAYRRWSEDNGHTPLNSSKWCQRLESLGYERFKRSSMHIYGLVVNHQLAFVSQLTSLTN